eukprot:1161590-Pelagomonas_calceolata.AAC.9
MWVVCGLLGPQFVFPSVLAKVSAPMCACLGRIGAPMWVVCCLLGPHQVLPCVLAWAAFSAPMGVCSHGGGLLLARSAPGAPMCACLGRIQCSHGGGLLLAKPHQVLPCVLAWATFSALMGVVDEELTAQMQAAVGTDATPLEEVGVILLLFCYAFDAVDELLVGCLKDFLFGALVYSWRTSCRVCWFGGLKIGGQRSHGADCPDLDPGWVLIIMYLGIYSVVFSKGKGGICLTWLILVGRLTAGSMGKWSCFKCKPGVESVRRVLSTDMMSQGGGMP